MLNYAHTRQAGCFSNRTPKGTTESELPSRLCETRHKTSNKGRDGKHITECSHTSGQSDDNLSATVEQKSKPEVPPELKKKKKKNRAIKSFHCEIKTESDFISCDYVMPDVDLRAKF